MDMALPASLNNNHYMTGVFGLSLIQVNPDWIPFC